MAENKITSEPSSAFSQNAARLAFAGAAIWVILIVVLHILEPEFDPSWRMLSEYELGSYGWMMQLAFFSMGLSCLSTLVALWPYMQTAIGRIGLVSARGRWYNRFRCRSFYNRPYNSACEPATVSGDFHTVCGSFLYFVFRSPLHLIGQSLARIRHGLRSSAG